MYVNALREPSCHQSDSTSACVGLSLLLYISPYFRQGQVSGAHYKRRAEGLPDPVHIGKGSTCLGPVDGSVQR